MIIWAELDASVGKTASVSPWMISCRSGASCMSGCSGSSNTTEDGITAAVGAGWASIAADFAVDFAADFAVDFAVDVDVELDFAVDIEVDAEVDAEVETAFWRGARVLTPAESITLRYI